MDETRGAHRQGDAESRSPGDQRDMRDPPDLLLRHVDLGRSRPAPLRRREIAP
jgi:hypothetical protein